MPLGNHSAPLTGMRKSYYEDLRKNHVPRYLFRCWSSCSGGGRRITKNNETEIVPPAFVKGVGHKLYDMNEKDIEEMARAHYSGYHQPLSEFSSWTASLHFVLIYAEWMHGENRRDTHIAIMDTKSLDEEVLVWHCPQIMKGTGNHEFLAHGRIKGKGYKAVAYDKILKAGLKKILPELTKPSVWSDATPRTTIFNDPPAYIETDTLVNVHAVATLFGDLALPLAAALICLRPRPWISKERRKFLCFGGSRKVTSVSSQEVNAILLGLGSPEIPAEWASERWLRPGMVDTYSFPQVQQWIALLHAMSKQRKGIFFQRPSKSCSSSQLEKSA